MKVKGVKQNIDGTKYKRTLPAHINSISDGTCRSRTLVLNRFKQDKRFKPGKMVCF